MLDEKNKIYIWNKLPSIVVVKHKYSFKKIVNWGNKENYIILLLREARASYLSINVPRVGKHFKKCVL